MAIPKVLHYCWFGKKPLPKETIQYMKSWKKFCPDYVIKEWNETNFDIHCCKFVEQAYESKKWAFVADYARFFAMYVEGGVYVETDTEIIRPINELIEHNAFFGFGPNTMTLPLCGTCKGHSVAKSMIDYYRDRPFIVNGKQDLTTVNQILFQTLTKQFGLIHNNQYQVLDDNIAVYPKEYFFSTDWKTGKVERNNNLFVVHYADASWLDEKNRESLLRNRKYIKLFGSKVGARIGAFHTSLKNNGVKESYLKIRKHLFVFLTPKILKIVSHLRINPHKVVFDNFYGRGYGDNPKYIAEELIKRNSGYKLVWIVDDVKKYKLPDCIKQVQQGSIRELIELGTAKFWIDNIRKDLYIYKHPQQVYIQTWHGSFPFKHIEKDAADVLGPEYVHRAKHDSEMADLFISGCTARTHLYRKSFWYDGIIEEWGTPRNDVFFNDIDYKAKICNQIGVNENINLCLYAPTFRDDHSIDAYNLDYTRLLESLSSKFGGEWALLVRLHPAIRELSESIKFDGRIINASLFDDIQELYAASELLITDYSSCMFDFMLTKRPVFLYTSDLNKYLGSRNLYMDIRKLPFPLAENMEELIAKIMDFDNKDYEVLLHDFSLQVGFREDGKASMRVVNYILNKSEK